MEFWETILTTRTTSFLQKHFYQVLVLFVKLLTFSFHTNSRYGLTSVSHYGLDQCLPKFFWSDPEFEKIQTCEYSRHDTHTNL